MQVLLATNPQHIRLWYELWYCVKPIGYLILCTRLPPYVRMILHALHTLFLMCISTYAPLRFTIPVCLYSTIRTCLLYHTYTYAYDSHAYLRTTYIYITIHQYWVRPILWLLCHTYIHIPAIIRTCLLPYVRMILNTLALFDMHIYVLHKFHTNGGPAWDTAKVSLC